MIEAHHGVARRWNTSDEKYLFYFKKHSRYHYEEIKGSLWSASVKRHFLLRQKSKYAGKFIN